LNKNNFLKIGLIGFNKSNGHFFSYPAIINGYIKKKFEKLHWPNILNYLEKESKKKFNIKNAKITTIWCQNYSLSKKVSKACNIESPVKDYKNMLNKVDAVIIARDDWKSHLKLSLFFLKNKKKVFIDKPLTLSKKELYFFSKYLKSNFLLSCSALRFSAEIKKVKNVKTDKMELFTVNDFNKYSIHMLEFAYLLGFKKILKYAYKGNNLNIITPKGEVNINFNDKNKFHSAKLYYKGNLIKKIIFKDNFYMFKSMLKNFIKFCKNKKIYSYKDTIKIIENLIKLKINEK